jgi:beta-lactamase regulating signal transducer with metallopeptidase domain/uncharacterized protein involved in exopolysaccharide biosynthesis
MMPWIELIEHPLVQRIGWVLLHFVWQGATIALVWGIARALLRGHDPRLRYGLACLLLGGMIVAPVVTFHLIGSPPSPAGLSAVMPKSEINSLVAPTWMTGVVSNQAVPFAQSLAEGAAVGLERALPWLVILWWAGVCGLSVRLLHGYWRVRQVTSAQTRSMSAEWRDRFHELQRRLRMSRPVALLQSAAIEVPAVVGWLRPVVLVPASSLSGLTPAQLELILAHELAHIRRHDHWVNLVQVLVETVLFYHPAVWWLSREIRRERELCCDDLAVATCGNRLAYARALSALEGLRQRSYALALGAGGGSLLERIRHIVGLPGSPAAGWRRSVGGVLLGSGLLLFMVGLGCIALSTREPAAVCRIAYHGWSGQAPQGAYHPDWLEPPRSEPQLGVFVRTEIALLRSRPFLTEVAERSGLASQRASEELVPARDDIVHQLRRRLDIRRVPDSAMVEIRVKGRSFGLSPEEAADLANMIAEVYREARVELRDGAARRGLAALKEEWAKQEHEVGRLQADLDEIRGELGISQSMMERGTLPHTADPAMISRLEVERITVEAQFFGLNSLLNQLLALQTTDADGLRKAILTAQPDNELGKLLIDYWQVEANLAKLNAMHGSEHPEVRQMSAMADTINRNVNERIEGILQGLQLRADGKSAELQALQEAAANARRLEAELAERYQPYLSKRRDLENVQRMRDVILLRVLQEQTDAAIPSSRSADVEVIEPAVASGRSVRTQWRVGLALCAAGLLSTLTGLVFRVGERSGLRNPAS